MSSPNLWLEKLNFTTTFQSFTAFLRMEMDQILYTTQNHGGCAKYNSTISNVQHTCVATLSNRDGRLGTPLRV